MTPLRRWFRSMTGERRRQKIRAANAAVYAIENLAAIRAYRAGLGVSEWEACLSGEQKWAHDYFTGRPPLDGSD